MSEIKENRAVEILTSECKYLHAKQAFEVEAADFDKVIKIEDAW